MRKGEKMSDEQKAKIAAAHTGRKLSSEHLEKMRAANTGRKQSPEHVAKRTQAITGKKRTPEFCEQMRKIQANLTPEQRAANVERLRISNADPVRREANRQRLIARNKARKGKKLAFSPVRQVGSTDPVFYVYEHWRTDKGQCFYVGKGFGKRANDMRNRNRWHKFVQTYLSGNGFGLEVKIIATGLTERQAFDMETQRIAFWKNDGCDLVNLTVGGDGPSGRKHTDDWKKAMSARMTGRVMSPESRAKISAAAMGNQKGKGKKKPPEVIAKVAAANRGKKRSPETKALLSEIRKANPTFRGKHHTAEAIEKIRVGNVGHVRSDETRARMSAHKKTDDHKSKLRNASLMWWAAKKAAETQK